MENECPLAVDAMDYISWQEKSSEMEGTPKDDGQKTDGASSKHVSWQLEPSEMGERDTCRRACSSLGSSLSSPDLIVCGGSPDLPESSCGETPEFITKASRRRDLISSVELSLENGIGSEAKPGLSSRTNKMFPEVKALNVTGSVVASLELLPDRENSLESGLPVASINVGGIDRVAAQGGIQFQEDNFFTGGEVISTDAKIGDRGEVGLYQTARYGNFSYHFQDLEAGSYLVDLHFAEIVFTEGPPGMRVFDIFIQEEKVASGIDIYAQVGSNQPLVLSNLEACVNGREGLSIRFQGVNGNPLVCGLAIKKHSCKGKSCQSLAADNILSVQGQDLKSSYEECINCNCKMEVLKLKRDYSLLCMEQTETKRSLEEAKRENELKNKECTEAWTSLRELQNELMRKSMHVGSLAYAVEGQVKEKSRWFSSLKELSKKFKTLKTEHQKLSEEALECKKCLADVGDITTKIQSILNQQVDLDKQHEELKLKYTEGAKERKELYNKVLELKGNIRVFCRCRPLNEEELAVGATMAVDFESAKDGELAVKASGAPKKAFKFDAVFSPQADQADVFEDTAPFAASVLDGYNVCIFAYGQTGTGKTFTMEGTEEARGVNYRTLEELFRIIDERKGLFKYEISVSVLEVYNEQIRDLLLSASQPGAAAKRLEIKQVAEEVHHVPGLVEANVQNMNEVWEVLQTGTNARAVGSTNANEHSSRSHCIHCVMVKGQNLINGERTRSKLWLVDLAGSERIAKTEVQGDRLKEAQNINRSLSALGDVISALSNKNSHIPFRNSKLTHLLQDSLGGDSKTLMFVQISPNENDLSETLCSLNFASRVRGIELGPAKKQVDVSELFRYKQMVDRVKQDTKSKDDQIKRLEETIQSVELKVRTRDVNCRHLQDKVKELESQLLIERRLARQHVDTKIAEQHQQQEEQQTAITKPPLAMRQTGTRQVSDPPTTSIKDLVNVIRPLTDYNSNKSQLPPISGLLKYKYVQKENKPEVAEEPTMTRRPSRASICTTARRIQVTPVPQRRNSLIPLPSAATATPLHPPVRPMATLIPPPLPRPLPLAADKRNADAGDNFSEMTPWSSKVGCRSSKINNILRRSIQKKVYIKSPLPPPQHSKRTSAFGAMERVRVSFGSQGRMTQRVLVSNSGKTGKEKQLVHKEKERGWNHGTVKSFL
ncbi:kinesin-like protein KIN-14Q isoform X2 [Aristolochia californica]|uniref:kinesin-like protein KIN-14Q isoform X2 n=1 Tax=Aristolochia californica TaxID=171875 RepID=UPI0035E02B6A